MNFNRRLIREVIPGDLPSILSLVRELGYDASRTQMENRLSAITGSQDHLLLVASAGEDKVVAFIHVHVRLSLQSGNLGEIGALVVSESYQGRGIGRALVAEAEGWGVERGLRILRVRSQIVREGAKRFYAGLGFSVTKEQRVFDKVF